MTRPTPKSMDDIATALQGYDPQALNVSQVSDFLSHLVTPLSLDQAQTLPLPQALDRFLAEDVVSPISVPPHNNSAMDGYAFDGAQLKAGPATTLPLTLRVVGTALAGKA